MLTDTRPLIDSAFCAYRVGADVPRYVPQCTSDKLLERQLWVVMRSRTAEIDRTVTRKIAGVCSKAVDNARKDPSEARQLVSHAEVIEASHPLLYEARLLAGSFIFAAKGYIEYVCSRFDAAESCMQLCLANEAILDNNFGYGCLHLRRIHLAENIAKVYIRAGRLADGVNLAGNLLAYLNGQEETIAIGGPWSLERLVEQENELVLEKCASIAALIAEAIAGVDKEKARFLFDVTNNFGARNLTQCRFVRIGAWFKLTEAYLYNDLRTFLEVTEDFLRQGRLMTSPLWYSALANLLQCVSEGIPDEFSAEIAAKAEYWADVPKVFRPALGRSNLKG
jgi:hypothetical protein